MWGSDIWFHLYLGDRVLETFSADPPDQLVLQGRNNVNFYWLYQIVVRGFYALGGAPAVRLFTAALWMTSAWFWLQIVRPLRLHPWSLLLALASILVVQLRFDDRPEVVSYAFILYFALTIVRRGDQPVREIEALALLGLQVLWCNVHGYFLFGPALYGLRALTLVRSNRRILLSHAAMTVALVLASMVSPFGWRTWAGVMVQLADLSARGVPVQELGVLPGPSAEWPSLVFWGLWAATAVVVALFCLRRDRRRLFPVALAVVALVISRSAVRTVVFIVVLAAPLWGAFIDEVERWEGRAARHRPRAVAAVLGAACLLLGWWTVTNGFHKNRNQPQRFGVGVSPFTCPIQAQAYLKASGFRGKIFSHPGDAGYIEFFNRDVSLYGDSRFTYDLGLIKEYFSALESPAAFQAVEARVGFDAVLITVETQSELLASMLADRRWHLAHADLRRAFFTRGKPREQRLMFYDGADLAETRNADAATSWIGALTTAGARDLLGVALGQLAAASQVPPALIGLALEYLIPRADVQLLAKVIPLREKMTETKGAIEVDQLLTRIPGSVYRRLGIGRARVAPSAYTPAP